MDDRISIAASARGRPAPLLRAAVALLSIRLSLGYFLGVWAINKLIAPDQSVRLYQYFYGVGADVEVVSLLGAAQAVLAAALVLGVWRGPVYLAGLAVHSATIVVIAWPLLTPFAIEDGFPVNRAYAASVPVWAAFAALYLLRDLDWLSAARCREWPLFAAALASRLSRREGRGPNEDGDNS